MRLSRCSVSLGDEAERTSLAHSWEEGREMLTTVRFSPRQNSRHIPMHWNRCQCNLFGHNLVLGPERERVYGGGWAVPPREREGGGREGGEGEGEWTFSQTSGLIELTYLVEQTVVSYLCLPEWFVHGAFLDAAV